MYERFVTIEVYANPYGHGDHQSMCHNGRGHGRVPFPDMPTRMVGCARDHEIENAERWLKEGHDPSEGDGAYNKTFTYRFHSQSGVVVGKDASENPKPVTLRFKVGGEHHAYFKRFAAEGFLVPANPLAAKHLEVVTLDPKNVPYFAGPMKVLAESRKKAHADWERHHEREAEGALGPKPMTTEPPAPVAEATQTTHQAAE